MSKTACSSATADGFDNIPEYVLERLMDSFSDDLYVDESLFVEGDNVCIFRPVADSINEDCGHESMNWPCFRCVFG